MWRRWLLKRAAKQYAGRLPGQIRRNYGAKEWYTFAQVQRAIATSGLDQRYAILAYARYLPRSEFENLRIDTPLLLEYGTARALFVAAEPVAAESHSRDPIGFDSNQVP